MTFEGDGDADRIETYTLDESGDRIRIDVDTGADGNTDRVERYEVDAGGKRIRTDFDDDADGIIDRSEIYALDADGNRIRTDFDDDGDGIIDRSEIYTLDADGNRIRIDFDDDGDGTIDRSEIYTLDADGNRIRTDFDDDGDGIIDRSEIYTLDGDGNRIRIDFDDDADGAIDRVEFDDDADGVIDRSEIYTYDENGRRVRTDFDDNNDGIIDRVEFNDNTPIFTSAATVRVEENQAVAYRAVATDADGDALSYSLSGTDADLFTINPATGVVSFIAPPDFEAPGDNGGDNVYNIVVTASDGANSTDQTVAITVTNVDEVGNPPVFTSGATASVAENQTAVYTAQATDADGDPLSYSLSGTDAALFTIDPATGVVSFIAPPDAENPGDADRDNVYDIVVTASDGPNRTNQPVTITVTNVNDNTPSFTSPDSADVEENQRLAYTTIVTDADGDALSYSLSGTDAALFRINPATGAVSFIGAPDFEMPGDAGGDNVYDIVVTASDGTNSAEQTVAITVMDVNEVGNAPIFTSDASAALAENQTAAYTAMATDADGDALSYSLSGTDAALFTIGPTTGAVSFIAPPDAENPGDADRDNVYDIVVTASDGPNRTNQPVAITVTNVNDNTPSFTSATSVSVAENQRVDSVVYRAMATDADGDPLSLQPVRDGCGPVHDRPGYRRGPLYSFTRLRESGRRRW